nr:hypothetical protein [Micromonospora sp. DSM 115978]
MTERPASAVTLPPAPQAATAPDGGTSGGHPAPAAGQPPVGGWRGRFEAWQLAEILVAWLVARVVVGAALGLTRFVSNEVGDGGGQLATTGLLGWDAGWYETIAENGYEASGDESRRF